MHEKKCDKAAAVFDIICAILCIVSIFIILEGTKKYGPGVTHDSVAYMFAAASAANGKGLQYFAYTSPFIQWPPLFPLILAVSRPLGIDPLAFSRYFNAIVMSLALWTGSRTVSRLTEHGFMPVLFILMGMLSFPLISMSFYVWSEPLFILLSAVAFHIVLTSDFKSGYIKPVLLAGLITALACLTRYAGLVTAAMICLYLPFRIEKPLDKFNAAFLFGCVSIIPVTVFMIRNDTLTGTLMGMRIPSGIPPSVNFGRAAKTIAGWISPVVSEPGAVSGFFLFAVISSFILLTAILLWQIFINPSKRHVLLFFSSYCLFYSVYMAVSATRVSLDPVSDRYMIPVMLPLLTIIALILDGALKKTEISPKAASIAVLVILTALITYSMTANAVTLKKSVLKAESEGAGGFNTVYWKNHSFLSRLELLKESDMAYSNNPGAIRFLTGKRVHYSPKKTGLLLYGYNAFLKESENYSRQYIIWFGNEISASIYTPREFERDFTVAEVYRDDKISIYKLERNKNEKAWLYP